jgi:putative phage-type endonuclease
MSPKEVKLEQGTPQWLAWREAGIGSSDAASLLGMFGGIKKKKYGRGNKRENWAMARGRELEPHARIKFIEKTGIWIRPSCWEHATYPFLRASLDGLSDNNDLIVEIKCPSMETHLEAVQGIVKPYYEIQVNHQMLVLGHRSAIYWSFNPDHPDPDLQCAMVRLQRNEEICSQIIEKAIEWMKETKRYDSFMLKSVPN